MPDEFQIKISTPADLSGAKALADELKKTIALTKEAGGDTANFEKRLAAVDEEIRRSGREHENASGKVKEHAKQTEFLGQKTGELKRLVRELGATFPFLGELGRLALNPIAAALSIAIGLFAKAKERIDAMNRALDEMGERAAHGFGNMRESIEEATRAIAAANSEIAKKLKEYGEAQDDARTKTDDLTAAIRRQEQAELAKIDALVAERTAQIELQRQVHHIDPTKGISDSEADRMESLVQGNAARSKNRVQDEADSRAIGVKADLLATAQENQQKIAAVYESLDKSHASRDAKIIDLPQRISKAAEDIDAAKQSLKALESKREREQARPQSWNPIDQFGPHFGPGNPTEEALKKIDTQTESALSGLKQTQHFLSQSKDELAKLNQEAKDYDAAKSAAESAKAEIKRLTHEIEELKKAAVDASKLRAATTSSSAATSSIEQATAAIASAKPGGPLPPGISIDKTGGVNVAPNAQDQAENRRALFDRLQSRLTREQKAASQEEWEHMEREPSPGENRPHETEHLRASREHAANAQAIEKELALLRQLSAAALGDVRRGVIDLTKENIAAYRALQSDMAAFRAQMENMTTRQRQNRINGPAR